MEEKYFALLDELMIKYSLNEYGKYKDGSSYKQLFYYGFTKGLLSFTLEPDGNLINHTELINSIVNDLIIVLPKDYKYKLSIGGYYCFIQNGDLNLNFVDGKYYIKSEHQEMHVRKEVATITEVINLNNIAYPDFKWNVLKKKSIELGFTPVKEKNGIENLYLIEAFKVCYPEYNYDFGIKNELLKDLNIDTIKQISGYKEQQIKTTKITYLVIAIISIILLAFIYYKKTQM